MQSKGWQQALADRAWINTFLASDEFEAVLQEEIATTETVLRDIGLVQ